ncbi:MAG: diguanylate cyclase [Thermodesulfobacteriota bacterium]|jgi:diguanylate cyclase (GGDEF)-like protein/PAS domain S-box-containing protein
MATDQKSKEDLLQELEALRRRVAELEALEDRRKQAEASLRGLEEKSRAIMENIEDGYYEVDLAGNYLFCNESYANLHGLPKEELIERSYKGVVRDSKKTYQIFNTVFRTGMPTKSMRRIIFRRDGSQREIDSSISLIRDENGQPIGFRGITRDMTERNRTEEELKNTVSLLEATIESTNDGILVVDGQGKITRYNQKFVELWGIPDSILKTRDDNQAISYVLSQLKDPDGFIAKVNELYAHPDDESFDTLEFKDGRIIERYSKPQWVDGKSIGRVWNFRDVTQRKQGEERLRTLSLVDDLTGIYNRRGFLTLAEQELKLANRLKRGMFLLFADLDDLKDINDTYGHQEGDRALIAVGNVIKETYRDPDIIARIGGDEFVVLAIEGASESSAENLRIRLNHNLGIFNARERRRYSLILSMGVVRYDPDHPASIEDLIAEADKRMYEEKGWRKNRPR